MSKNGYTYVVTLGGVEPEWADLHARFRQSLSTTALGRISACGKSKLYSAASVTFSGSTRAAQNLNSGILPNGSSTGLVSRLAAAST